MNPQLLALARSGNRNSFINVARGLFPNMSQTDLDNLYLAYQAQARGSFGPSGGGGGGSSGGGFDFNIVDRNSLLGRAVSYFTGTLESLGDALKGQRAELENSQIPGVGVVDFAAMRAGAALQGTPLDTLADVTQILLIKKQIIDQLRQEAELQSEINQRTQLGGDLSIALRDDIAQSAVYAANFGFTMRDLGEFYIDLVKDSGKFALVNEKILNMTTPLARSLGLTMNELATYVNEYEKVGLGAKQTLVALEGTTRRSVALGLSGKKIATDIQTNISRLNEYGFQNGIRGLERMAQKATEFRMSMDGVFKIAEDVMDPDKALALTANLQVLGGAIGDFNDPLKLMYMATNNVEGLQDALHGAASNLATYNKEQGRFEITGINLRRAKEMASALNVDFRELTKGAVAAAERASAASALLANNIKIDEKQIEFLTNLARMEDGEMKIMLPEKIAQGLTDGFKGQTEIAISELTQANAEYLLANQKQLEDMSVQDMARGQLTELQKMSRDIGVMAAYFKYQLTKEYANPLIKEALDQAGDLLGIGTTADAQTSFKQNLTKELVSVFAPTSPNPFEVPLSNTTTQNTTTTSNQNVNVNVTFSSDTDSDNARRLYEEEMRKNPRDFTDFKEYKYN